MRINVNVMLDQGETLSFEPDHAATQVITALGGDLTQDFCMVYVQSIPVPGESGKAGKEPEVTQPEVTPPPPVE